MWVWTEHTETRLRERPCRYYHWFRPYCRAHLHGYELFCDKGTLNSEFITGDVLDPTSEISKRAKGQFDIVYAAYFFHVLELG
jgi:hypothetical protein